MNRLLDLILGAIGGVLGCLIVKKVIEHDRKKGTVGKIINIVKEDVKVDPAPAPAPEAVVKENTPA